MSRSPSASELPAGTDGIRPGNWLRRTNRPHYQNSRAVTIAAITDTQPGAPIQRAHHAHNPIQFEYPTLSEQPEHAAQHTDPRWANPTRIEQNRTKPNRKQPKFPVNSAKFARSAQNFPQRSATPLHLRSETQSNAQFGRKCEQRGSCSAMYTGPGKNRDVSHDQRPRLRDHRRTRPKDRLRRPLAR